MTSAPLDRRWKCPVVPFMVRDEFLRPDANSVARLRGVDITVLADLVGRLYTMNCAIRPLYTPALAVVGVATTVKVPPGDNLGVMHALRLVKPGDVLVIDAMGFTEWCLGGFEILDLARRERGLAGVVVNGAYRDGHEAQAAAFPLYGKALAPFSGPKMGPAEVNVPVCCGDVVVHPGDVIAAGEEGVAVVPRESLARVVQALDARSKAGGHGGIEAFMSDMDRYVGEFFTSGRGMKL